MNHEEYVEIKDCKYHYMGASIDSNEVFVLCTRNAKFPILKQDDIWSYCEDCVGKKCPYKAIETLQTRLLVN